MSVNTREPNAGGMAVCINHEYWEHKIRSLRCAMDILIEEDGNLDFPLKYAIDTIRKEIWETFDEMTSCKRVYTNEEFHALIDAHWKKPLAPDWKQRKEQEEQNANA